MYKRKRDLVKLREVFIYLLVYVFLLCAQEMRQPYVRIQL